VTVGRGVVVAGAVGVVAALVVLLAGCNDATAAPALPPSTAPARTNPGPATSATVSQVPPGTGNHVPPVAGTLPTVSARATRNSAPSPPLKPSPTLRPSPALRPMTSGESQYRYGCQQGYIMQGCDQFTDEALRRKGIDPNS
jgi:hypothetical protein